jgi:hypothetical protein
MSPERVQVLNAAMARLLVCVLRSWGVMSDGVSPEYLAEHLVEHTELREKLNRLIGSVTPFTAEELSGHIIQLATEMQAEVEAAMINLAALVARP